MISCPADASSRVQTVQALSHFIKSRPPTPRFALLSPLSTHHQGRIWGLSAAEGLLSQVDSQIAAAAFDGEKWAGQVSDGSPAGRQAHRLALVKKAPPLCSHRRWM